MIKRIFICAHADFPRGGAEANYIEYMSLALMEHGISVYVFSRGENRNEEYCVEKECYCHNGIFYDNLKGVYNSTSDFLKLYFAEGRYIINLLKKYGANEHDQIVFYTKNYFYIREVYRYAQKKGIKSTMSITEWYQPFQYKAGILNPVYWLEEFGFEYGISMSKRVLPISNYLERHFQKKKCRTLCLPILANPPKVLEHKRENRDEITRFIYSGNAIKKDAIDMIVNSFAALDGSELLKLELHFTGMKESTVQQLREICGEAYKKIEAVLHIHDWLEYDELVKLYEKVDFLILLREKNKVTISNFPSKVPEMMGYGIIPVVSKVGDYTKEYLTDGKDSIQIDNCTIEEGVNAIRKALQMPVENRMEMRKNAYNTVVSKFYYKVWSDKLVDFLDGE